MTAVIERPVDVPVIPDEEDAVLHEAEEAADPKSLLIKRMQDAADAHLHMMNTIRERIITQAHAKSMCADGVDTFLRRCGMPEMLKNGRIRQGDRGESLTGPHPVCTLPVQMPAMNAAFFTADGLAATASQFEDMLASHRELIRRRAIRAAVYGNGAYIAVREVNELLVGLGFPEYVKQTLHTVTLNISVLSTMDTLADAGLEAMYEAAKAAFPGAIDQENWRDSSKTVKSTVSGPIPERGEVGWHSYDGGE